MVNVDLLVNAVIDICRRRRRSSGVCTLTGFDVICVGGTRRLRVTSDNLESVLISGVIHDYTFSRRVDVAIVTSDSAVIIAFFKTLDGIVWIGRVKAVPVAVRTRESLTRRNVPVDVTNIKTVRINLSKRKHVRVRQVKKLCSVGKAMHFVVRSRFFPLVLVQHLV